MPLVTHNIPSNATLISHLGHLSIQNNLYSFSGPHSAQLISLRGSPELSTFFTYEITSHKEVRA